MESLKEVPVVETKTVFSYEALTRKQKVRYWRLKIQTALENCLCMFCCCRPLYFVIPDDDDYVQQQRLILQAQR